MRRFTKNEKAAGVVRGYNENLLEEVVLLKVIKWLDDNLEEMLLTILLIAMSVIMIVQIIARYVFGNALTWSDELARYFLLWSGFLSVSYCVKKRISIKIEQFQNKLPESGKIWLKMLRHAIVFAFCVVMIPYAVTYVEQGIRNGAISPALHFPIYYMQVAPLVCFVLLAFRVLQAFIREFRASRKLMYQSLKHEIMDELLLQMQGEKGEEEGKDK